MALYGSLPSWDQRDLAELLTLDSDGQNRFRSHVCDINVHGEVYGGQLLAQALWAAAQSVRARSPSVLQMTALQAAHTRNAVEFSVETLQDDSRFSYRHVYGVQGTGLIFSASVAFKQPERDLRQSSRFDVQVPDPESLPTLDQMVPSHDRRSACFQLRFTGNKVLDVRPIHAQASELTQTGPGLEGYWIRLSEALPDEGCLHHAALAYMSECWLTNLSPIAPAGLDRSPLFSTRKLNHSLWFHSADINANDWSLFLHDPVRNDGVRDLVTTRIYRRNGQLLASLTQDILMSLQG
ncbi:MULTISPECIES: acyl-CoA thioesterase [unclassified Pseudomonas]|uniref:acyl-CoA thioesterase n=1 Tax=unclassified Pseudomonas TaxID=196821 RepID=UPI00384DDAC4